MNRFTLARHTLDGRTTDQPLWPLVMGWCFFFMLLYSALPLLYETARAGAGPTAVLIMMLLWASTIFRFVKSQGHRRAGYGVLACFSVLPTLFLVISKFGSLHSA